MAREGDRFGWLTDPAVGDEVFLALDDRVRRVALYYLRWRGRVHVEELADVVTGWTVADRRGMAARADRERVRAALLGEHLPLLDRAGLVDHDVATGTVAIEGLPATVGSLIDFAYDREWGSDAPP